MKKIFKYPVPIEGGQMVLPLQGDIVNVAMQDHDPDSLMVWAWFDEAPIGPKARRVMVVGTGHPVPWWADAHYGAVQDRRGLVWHLVGASLPVQPDAPLIPEQYDLKGSS